MKIEIDVQNPEIIEMIQYFMDQYDVNESDSVLNILSSYYEHINSK